MNAPPPRADDPDGLSPLPLTLPRAVRLPAAAYIPGGPFPRPDAPRGRPPDSADDVAGPAVAPPIADEPRGWTKSPEYLRGVALWNAGFYWESHEVWESLWHAHRRVGPTADIVKALIKLAAAGVKVRQGQPAGVVTHSERAARLFEAARRSVGATHLGLNLEQLAAAARAVAQDPPRDPLGIEAPVVVVFAFRLEPA